MSAFAFPWLEPYGGEGAIYREEDNHQDPVFARLNRLKSEHRAQVPEFVASTVNLGAMDYEQSVHAGSIPTRNLGHDWYNGLVWLNFPKAKLEINGLHVAEGKPEAPRLAGSANGRSRRRDALTLFDESGALLLTTQPQLACALINHDWHQLFVAYGPDWQQHTRLLLLGHGLLDALHVPHKGLCAKALPVHLPCLDPAQDELEAIAVQAVFQLQDPLQMSPLPVMGVPGWFEESNTAGFYLDTHVFRAKPTRHAGSSCKRLAFEWDGTTLKSGKCAGQSLPDFQGEESPDSSEHGAG